jgi:hypothetical protein
MNGANPDNYGCSKNIRHNRGNFYQRIPLYLFRRNNFKILPLNQKPKTHMKKIKTLILTAIVAMVATFTVSAQTVAVIPPLTGNIFTYQGQSFLISTNSAGQIVVSTFGVQGTNSIVVPTSPAQAEEVASQWIAENNPSETNFYGTNEIDARLGAIYLQSSGQAAAVLSVDKYGTFGWANVGFGAGIIQGQDPTKSTGTAAEYAEVVYRKPIGNVAAVGGLVAGYDNWNKEPFVGVKAGLEYRESARLGQFVDVTYSYEPHEESRGMTIGGGITYAF